LAGSASKKAKTILNFDGKPITPGDVDKARTLAAQMDAQDAAAAAAAAPVDEAAKNVHG
jgi:hypothetical protein